MKPTLQRVLKVTMCNRFSMLLCAVLIGAVAILWSSIDLQAQRARVDKETLEVQELRDLLSEFPDDAYAHYQLGVQLARQDRRDEALSHFERAISLDPESKMYGNRYRMTCIWFKECDRSIEYFEKLVEETNNSPSLRLQLALAYVDKMPSASLGIVSQGLLSNKSIKQLTKVIESDSSNWAAWYARAMNHLHWPRAMGHGDDAIADFQQALKIQENPESQTPKEYFAFVYIGLGDALVKEKRHDEARKIWRNGFTLFPRNARLAKRLSLTDDKELEEFLEEACSLSKQIDTDLSVLWSE